MGPGAYIEVIDGSSPTGPILDTFEYGEMNPLYVQSVSNAMYIYLKTEDYYEGGFFDFTVEEGTLDI